MQTWMLKREMTAAMEESPRVSVTAMTTMITGTPRGKSPMLWLIANVDLSDGSLTLYTVVEFIVPLIDTAI